MNNEFSMNLKVKFKLLTDVYPCLLIINVKTISITFRSEVGKSSKIFINKNFLNKLLLICINVMSINKIK